MLGSLTGALVNIGGAGTSGGTNNGTNGTVASVRSFGAKGDGVTNDTAAVVAAIAILGSVGSGTLYFPAGTYLVNVDALLLGTSNVAWLGDGPGLSILKANAGAGQLVQSSAVAHNLSFIGLTFDTTAGSITAFSLYGTNVQGISWHNCSFVGFYTGAAALSLDEVADATIADCTFWSPGNGLGTALLCTNGTTNLVVRRSEFRYLSQGIVIDTGSEATTDTGLAEYITVDGCHFDGGWWYLKPSFTNSGATVSYSSTVLTDSAATFSGISAFDTVRVMAVKQAGTTTALSLGLSITDSGADFVTAAIKRGEIVRVSGKFAVVSGVESATVLRVEEWLDATTFLPTTAPASGVAYNVYGITLGHVQSNTGTTITVDRWFDLEGTTLSAPAVHTLYEVAPQAGYSGFHAEAGARFIRIINNTFLRSWSDQVSLYGDDNLVANNVISDGQDMGVTINGTTGNGHTLVVGNKITHQGTGGIWLNGEWCVAAENVIVASQWANTAEAYIAGIIVAKDQCSVHGNMIDGKNQENSYFGISVGSSDGSTVANNTCVNDQNGGSIKLYTAAATNTRLRDNDAVNVFSDGAVGQDFGLMVGSGAPESSVEAGPGTLYRDTATGIVWSKLAGTGNTGWSWHIPEGAHIGTGDNRIVTTGGLSGEAVGFQDAFGNIAATSGRTLETDATIDGTAITQAESGYTFRNSGASGAVTLVLPQATNALASPGVWYKFCTDNAGAFSFAVQAFAGDIIRVNETLVTSSGGVMTFASASKGASITLECIKVGEWRATAQVGVPPTMS